jgi:hypothetical protein
MDLGSELDETEGEMSASTGNSEIEIKLLSPLPRRDLAGLVALDDSIFGSALGSVFGMAGDSFPF